MLFQIGLGIPEKKAKIYRDSVRDGSFLVMVNGTEAEITRAEAIMNHHDIDELGIYDATDLGSPSIDRIDEDIKNRADISDVEKIKLYEERLTVNKHRDQTGEVVIGKRVETEIATIAVPVERERLVIERTQVNTGEVVAPNTANFGDGQVVNIDLYEETATIDKQAFIREEVSVHKEVEQETVQRNETIRREELDLDVEGDVIKH